MSPELITWLAYLAFLLGIIALVLEIFVFTGFGVAGITGIILVGWGILLIAVDVTQATSALVIALITTIVLLLAGIKLLSRYNMWYKLTLQNRQQNEEGYVAPLSALGLFAGREGIALTPLRPSGAAEIDGQRLDVVTEGEFVSPGSPVQVIKVEGTRVVVKETKNV
ncbi:MAG: NfeD family protein [Desulfotomaculaceae bacterium]|nr:NfeD family protein [Desulfotomaculaceae bacterium]